MFILVNRCEGFTHLWEGRDALGEGVSWAQQCSWEILLCEEMVLLCSWSMGSMEAICLLYFWRYKGMCVRGGFIESLEEACYKFSNFICYEDMAFSSLESPPSPHVSWFSWWINVQALWRDCDVLGVILYVLWDECMYPFMPCFP